MIIKGTLNPSHFIAQKPSTGVIKTPILQVWKLWTKLIMLFVQNPGLDLSSSLGLTDMLPAAPPCFN